MNDFMLGNEAIARGAYEAGVRLVSSYPGTPSTEITEYWRQIPGNLCEWAANEKVAAGSVCGREHGGRALHLLHEARGLNVASDPLYTLAYTGVNGGLVVVVADDPGMGIPRRTSRIAACTRAVRRCPCWNPATATNAARLPNWRLN